MSEIDSRTIELGGKTFNITVPLTLDQLIEANVGMADEEAADPQARLRQTYARARRVILIAIKPNHPEETEESLLALRCTLKEFNAATRVVYKACGLIADDGKGGAPGEAEAAAE